MGDLFATVPSTFIGALIISIVAGYLVKWMNQKIQLPDFLLAFKTTFLLPILSAIFVMLAMYYVITPLVAGSTAVSVLC